MKKVLQRLTGKRFARRCHKARETALLGIVSLLTPAFPAIATGILYHMRFGRSLNLKDPSTYNEKLLWLKLYGNDSLSVRCGDKFTVRDFVIERGCPEILNELVAVFDSPEDIPFASLPDRYALKVSNGCQYNLIKRDASFDESAARRQLARWLKVPYGRETAEPHYGRMKARIVCERYLEDPFTGRLDDYKVHCLNGVPVYIVAFTERQRGSCRSIRFDFDGEIIRLPGASEPDADLVALIPDAPILAGLKRYAEILSRGIPLVRIDFYIVEGRIVFGEMTFTPGAGMTAEVDRVFALPRFKTLLDAVVMPTREG